jgi:predicted nucleic acid-binding protein
MSERIVIDASVAIAHLHDEVGTMSVDAALLEWSRAGISLVVPAVFWMEILNSLGTRHRYTAAQAAEALHELDELEFETVEADRPGHLLIADAVERHRMSAYDAGYLALAQLLGAPLATLDRNLAAAAGPLGLLIGSPDGARPDAAPRDEPGTRETRETRETRAPYDRPSTLPAYAGLGAYLGELRRRAAIPG